MLHTPKSYKNQTLCIVYIIQNNTRNLYETITCSVYRRFRLFGIICVGFCRRPGCHYKVVECILAALISCTRVSDNYKYSVFTHLYKMKLTSIMIRNKYENRKKEESKGKTRYKKQLTDCTDQTHTSCSQFWRALRRKTVLEMKDCDSSNAVCFMYFDLKF
jgi:hypothetical protein